MSEPTDETRAVACNYTEGTNVAPKGAKAFVLGLNPGNAGDRVLLVVRSRGGRWVEKWEDSRRLCNVRVVTVVRAAHPSIFDDLVDRQTASSPRLAGWIERTNTQRVPTPALSPTSDADEGPILWG